MEARIRAPQSSAASRLRTLSRFAYGLQAQRLAVGGGMLVEQTWDARCLVRKRAMSSDS
jgi:hypothetical protein